MKKTLITVLALLISTGAYAAGNKTKIVTAKDYGDKWPFTFEKGELTCVAGSAVVVKNSKDGKSYALNGMANAFLGRELGGVTMRDTKEATKPHPQVKGYQMSTLDFMVEGEKLCK